MTTLAVEVIRDEASLRALAEPWAALWARTTAPPFLHPAWLLPWWAQFGSGAPRAAVLHGDGGRLLGMLPLYDLNAERKVLPMGVGLSDYHDALLDPAAPGDAASTLLQAAMSGCGWPCHLPELPPGAALLGARVAGWIATEHQGETCPVLRPGDVPPGQRRKLRMARHRAERIGGCAVVGALTPALSQREREFCPLSLWERTGVRVPASDETLFEHLVRLHAARWRAAGEPGVLADLRVRAFHAGALPALAAAGLLRLRALAFGETIVAVIYALQAPGNVFFYLSGFDAAHRFQSPGTILLGAMIEEAAAEGVTELHFLRGAEAYKYAWGARDRRNATLILEPA